MLFLAVLSTTTSPPPTIARWLTGLASVRYTSRTGASVTLATAIAAFSDPDGNRTDVPPRILSDASRGLISVCFAPTPPPQALCAFDIVLRANDVRAPPDAMSGRIKDAALGLSLSQLIARFHADTNLAGKNLVRGVGGVVVLVTATDEDPPPSRYDHGYQAYLLHDYFLRDGIVVAHAFKATEN